MGYSVDQKYQIIRLYFSHNNILRVQNENEFHQIYPGQRIPSANTIRYIKNQFDGTKTLQRRKRNVPRNDDDLNILLYFEENPSEASVPDAALYFNKSSYKILKYYKFHPYKFLTVQNLSEDNMRQRLHYCQEIARHIEGDPNFLNKILFTDEATFTTSGMFYRKNKHYWAKENPHKIQVVKIQGRRSIHVWCGMLSNKIIGPVIFDGNLNSEKFLEFLQREVGDHLEDVPIMGYNNVIWQQDGAPAHNVMPVTNYLNNRYDFWIGRSGTLRWDYNERPQNIQVLIERIQNEIFLLNRYHPDFISRSINSKLRRNIFNCINNQGEYIETM